MEREIEKERARQQNGRVGNEGGGGSDQPTYAANMNMDAPLKTPTARTCPSPLLPEVLAGVGVRVP